MRKKVQVVTTEDLILRPFQISDAPAMFQNWAQDPEVTKFLTWSPHESIAESLEICTEFAFDNQGFGTNWAIAEKTKPQEAIGSVNVVSRDEDIMACELGYCLTRKFWGRGYMSQAVKGAVDFLFREMDYNRIAARHDSNNPASGRVMEKAGMVREGVLRQAGKSNQGIGDMICYAILRSEWSEKQE